MVEEKTNDDENTLDEFSSMAKASMIVNTS